MWWLRMIKTSYLLTLTPIMSIPTYIRHRQVHLQDQSLIFQQGPCGQNSKRLNIRCRWASERGMTVKTNFAHPLHRRSNPVGLIWFSCSGNLPVMLVQPHGFNLSATMVSKRQESPFTKRLLISTNGLNLVNLNMLFERT